jgi:hypothetical protein
VTCWIASEFTEEINTVHQLILHKLSDLFLTGTVSERGFCEFKKI